MTLLVTVEAADSFLDQLIDAPVLAVDTETTKAAKGGFARIKDGRAYCMGIAVSFRHPIFGIMDAYFPFRHNRGANLPMHYLSKLKVALEDPAKHIIYHNAKFDQFALKTLGVIPRGKVYDTAVIAHMVNEEWPSKKLDWLSKYLLKDSKAKDEIDAWERVVGWDNIPSEIMAPYASHDTNLTLRLFELLWPQMKEQELDKLWRTENAFTQVLYGIEGTGLRVDRDFCLRKVEHGSARMDTLANELGFNPSSPLDLADFLLVKLGFPKFDKNGNLTDGKPSFAKAAMEEYDTLLGRDGRIEAKQVLEYRGWQKAVSSLYLPALELVSPDGRIRANFNQAVAVTGRLSCSEPNLQQIPRDSDKEWNGDAKRAFIPAEGARLLEFDYSQLEFRLATAYGRDKVLIDTFANDDDPFIPTAIGVFGGVKFRQSAKTLTYSTLYGAGLTRLMNALNLTQVQAAEVRESFRKLYPGIFQASNHAQQLAATRGFVRYWTGRRRHIEHPDFAYKAFNSVIQGGAAELVKHAILRVDREVVDSNRRIVLTVHDSIVMEVEEGHEERTIKEVTELMTDFPDFGVKLSVDSKLWGHKAA